MPTLFISAQLAPINLAGLGNLADSDSGWQVLFIPFGLGLLAFFGFYYFTWQRYRNANKNYRYEQVTDIRIRNPRAFDKPGGRRYGVRSSSIDARNNGRPRERVKRLF